MLNYWHNCNTVKIRESHLQLSSVKTNWTEESSKFETLSLDKRYRKVMLCLSLISYIRFTQTNCLTINPFLKFSFQNIFPRDNLIEELNKLLWILYKVIAVLYTQNICLILIYFIINLLSCFKIIYLCLQKNEIML